MLKFDCVAWGFTKITEGSAVAEVVTVGPADVGVRDAEDSVAPVSWDRRKLVGVADVGGDTEDCVEDTASVGMCVFTMLMIFITGETSELLENIFLSVCG